MSLTYNPTNLYSEISGTNIQKIRLLDISQSPFGNHEGHYGSAADGFWYYGGSRCNTSISDVNLTNLAGTEVNTLGWNFYDRIEDGRCYYESNFKLLGFNKFRYSATSSNTSPNEVWGWESRYRWMLSGSFDIEYSFENFAIDAVNTSEFAIVMIAITKTSPLDSIVYATFTNYGAQNYWRISGFTNGVSNTTLKDIPTANTSGKMRIVRDDPGHNLKVYYDDGGGWTDMGNIGLTGSVGYDPVLIKFGGYLTSYAGPTIASGSVDYINFKINSGNMVTESAWRGNETGSDYRSYVHTNVPNNLLAIGSNFGVNLWDISDSTYPYNEMWMRNAIGLNNSLSGAGMLPLDFSWSPNGNFYTAYGTIGGDDGGLIRYAFGTDDLRIQTTSSVPNSWATYNKNGIFYTKGLITKRNEGREYNTGSSSVTGNFSTSWGSTLSTDTYIQNLNVYKSNVQYIPYYWSAACEKGLRIYRYNYYNNVTWGNIKNSASCDAFDSGLGGKIRYRYCRFNQNNGDIHYTSNTKLYLTTFSTWSASMDVSIYGSYFGNSSVALAGTRDKDRQYWFTRDNLNNIYIPALEGIYRSDYNLNYHSLYLADSGGSYNILNTNDSIQIVKTMFCSASNKDYLLYGYTNGSDFGLGIVLLSDGSPHSNPRLAGYQSFIGISGSSALRDIERWYSTQTTSNQDKLYCFVAFTGSVYQLEIDVPTPYEGISCTKNAIGSNFTINNLYCLPVQYNDLQGNALDTVPYFLNTPGGSLRLRKLPLSSSY